MIRVIVVDDHPIVREGLKQIIGESLEMTVAAEAGDGHEALSVFRNVPSDVVLLDIALPYKNGLDVLKQLRAEKPRLPVLVLSNYSEEQYAVRCLRSGASGYLHKGSLLTEVVQAVRKVVLGGKYVSQSIAERVVVELHCEAPAHSNLSDREYQVVCMIASGKSVREVAAELALSVKTISTYRARVLEKLAVKNNLEIIRYAIKEGLVA